MDVLTSSPERTFSRPRLIRCAFVVVVLSLLAGCSTTEPERQWLPDPFHKPEVGTGALGRSEANVWAQDVSKNIAVHETPKPPTARTRAGEPAPAPILADPDAAVASISLENMPLGQFANAIFGDILKRNVSIDPQVLKRADLVTFRTGKPQSADQIFAAATALLKSYGVVVNDYNSTVRVMQDAAQTGILPEIRRGRASADIPAGLRPVFFFVELENTNVAQTTRWLRTLFQSALTIQDDPQRNALLLSGQSDTVEAAKDAIQLLDQPLMRGRVSARIAPAFWSADEMARRLVDLLQAEGYSAAVNAGANTPILVLPIAPINSVIVFASSEETLQHVVQWARELDQTPRGRAGNFITYNVRNTDATELASTLSAVMGMQDKIAADPSSPGAAALAANASRVVVNPSSNSLIIKTTPAEFQQWYALLQELDRPARSALIMATVAEVRLTEGQNYNFLWALKDFRVGSYEGSLGTTNIDLGSGGSESSSDSGSNVASGPLRFTLATLAGDTRVLLTALASHDHVKVLSNPSLVARSGQSATIQVGQQVPILTSQISNSDTSGVQQTIQYRDTGVILKVKPVIHAGGRIDLDISQEVSSAGATSAGVETTPTISTRKVETKASVSDGNTLLIGGLIQESKSNNNAGIPYLKDLPVIGNLFKTSAGESTDRTELVVLLTPYVIEDDFDARAITRAFKGQFSWAKGGVITSTVRSPQPSGSPADPVTEGEGSGDVAVPQEGASAQTVAPTQQPAKQEGGAAVSTPLP